MRCLLFVSERMLSRPKLMPHLTQVLAEAARVKPNVWVSNTAAMVKYLLTAQPATYAQRAKVCHASNYPADGAVRPVNSVYALKCIILICLCRFFFLCIQKISVCFFM